jgi:hypothetical protein
MRNRADVPGSREAVQADSVGLGPSPAPSPPSGHRRRRGHLGPDEPAVSGTFGVTAGFHINAVGGVDVVLDKTIRALKICVVRTWTKKLMGPVKVAADAP